uniref:Uncharacterized protein n=1 Tax=viral metagenome TaxID=1070528 RepID=A0A6M3J069_9ZZZZ
MKDLEEKNRVFLLTNIFPCMAINSIALFFNSGSFRKGCFQAVIQGIFYLGELWQRGLLIP